MTDRHDPLLDPPAWAPSWLPTVDDGRRFRALRWVVGAVFVAGLAGCVAQGGDQPADPVVVGAPAGTASTTPPATPPTEAAAPGAGTAPGALADPAAGLAERFGTVAARLVDLSGEVLELCLLHADTAEERAQGLMQVAELEGNDGMLFSVDEPSTGAFYMFKTVVPLTIGWFDADGAFVSRADMAPCDLPNPDHCNRYPPAGPWTHAIEVLQGDPLAERFRPGTTLEVTGGSCAA